MLWTILRKELLENLMSLRFGVACVLCFAVVLSSLIVRSEIYDQAFREYGKRAAIQSRRLRDIDDPSQIVWGGLTFFLEPNPLKVFVSGVDMRLGLTVKVNAHQPPKVLAAHPGNPLTPLFPPMDLTTFVGIIMSLLAMVFGYDAVCGERERGTLPLMLSYAVPRSTVLLGKWLGGYIALVLPCLIALLAGGAVVLLQTSLELSLDQWCRLGLVVLLALLYVAAVYAGAVWISTLTARPATSIMILVTVWLVMVLAIPTLSPYLAQAWIPGESYAETEQQRWTWAIASWKQEREDAITAYDKRHGIDERWWRELDRNQWTSRRGLVERQRFERECERRAALERRRIFDRTDERYKSAVDRQAMLARTLSRVSPYSCFAMAATELTDTGAKSERRFMNQIRDYQVRIIKYGFAEWLGLIDYELAHEGETRPWKELRKGPIPTFVFASAAGLELLDLVVVDAGLLLGMLVAFFLMSARRFARYRVA